ncbi:divergent PAP2 family protein [bacterium]|nr:divergent PAP2 family protein [bacterium]
MIFNNGLEALFNGVMAAIVAQILKLIGYLITHRKLNFKILTTTGGMPSSHSAGVIGLATTVAIIDGYTSVTFAIALGYALVVMYDAAGVRRSAGKIAAVLNRIKEDIYAHKPELIGDKLKELLGHTPFEVFVGAILGFVLAYVNHYFILG